MVAINVKFAWMKLLILFLFHVDTDVVVKIVESCLKINNVLIVEQK